MWDAQTPKLRDDGTLTATERRAAQLLELLPEATVERTRDVIQINYRGEEGIVVLVTAEAVELRLPSVEWTGGAYGPAGTSRLWRRRTWASLPDDALPPLLEAAQRARHREFHTCRYCRGSFPPEHRTGKDVCHACAEKHEGVVF